MTLVICRLSALQMRYALLAAFVALAVGSPANAEFNRACKPKYEGRLVLSPDSDGRSMTLMRPFGYRARDCTRWHVPKNAGVDGASIPRVLWTVIGGPWDGPYRNASVIHDWYCYVRTEPWRKVHRMFYEAMLTSGVGPIKAKIMYAAVYKWGPRWDELTTRNSRLISLSQRSVSTKVSSSVALGYFAVNHGHVLQAEQELRAAESQMRSSGDQFAVASLARSIGAAKSDPRKTAEALDSMVASGVGSNKLNSTLLIERAAIAFAQRDMTVALAKTREALAADPGNAAALNMSRTLRQTLPSDFLEYASVPVHEPSEREFDRLKNIIEQQDPTLDQIEAIADSESQ